MENRHKREITDLTRSFEQVQTEKEKLERYAKEVRDYSHDHLDRF